LIKLPRTLATWKTPAFATSFKAEIAGLEHQCLPLQQSLSLSSYVSNEPVSAIIINTDETRTRLNIKAGLFYTGIIAGCSCADDPTPLDTQNEYCEVLFSIDKQTGEAEVILDCTQN